MPVLLDLPPELISVIIKHLALDSQALNSLCLAGHHTLLACARPYTWREINATIGDGQEDENKSNGQLAARFQAFLDDPVKASAVRSFNITLIGSFDVRTPAIEVLGSNIQKLVNVTHASVSCVNSVAETEGTDLFVVWVVQGLPSLLSLTVDGCSSGDGNDLRDCFNYEDPADPDPLPSLVHIAMRFCDTSLDWLLMHCLNLKVVEMECGDGEKFWRENALDTSKEFEGYADGAVGLRFLPGLDLNDQPTPILKLERINLIGDTYDSLYLFDPDGESPPCLKDLYVNRPLDVGLFSDIIRSLNRSVIERLSVGIPRNLKESEDEEEPDEEPEDGEYKWVPSEFEQFLQELDDTPDGEFFAQFERMRELGLPTNGLGPTSMDLLLKLLTHAPALEHLSFEAPGKDSLPLLLGVAHKYFGAIATLRSVSWKNECTYHAEDDGGAITWRPYVTPTWYEWTGIGKWWEI
ncbi:hypothetical protein C8J57DRAFT_362017 [Mycena rebaudengoi]|nr:hypothetical protein C8J57DRAFT_362017 [Mycena rebaudengoi]